MEITQVITLVGIVATFAVGIVNLVTVLQNAKRTTFTASVTSARIKYIQDIRENISKFCGLAHFYNLNKGSLSPEKLSEIHKEADSLRYLIRLFLNPEDTYWDTQIMMRCDEIIEKTNQDFDVLHVAVEDLITITQYLLKLEWQGIKEEAKNGSLTDKKRTELYQLYISLHQRRSSHKEETAQIRDSAQIAGFRTALTLDRARSAHNPDATQTDS